MITIPVKVWFVFQDRKNQQEVSGKMFSLVVRKDFFNGLLVGARFGWLSVWGL